MDEKESLWKSWIVGCDDVPGHSGVIGVCNKCPAGRASSSTSNNCKECMKGFYMPDVGQSSCLACPQLTTTLKIGSKSISDCVNGYDFFGDGKTSCKACPKYGFCKVGRSIDIVSGFWRSPKNKTKYSNAGSTVAVLGQNLTRILQNGIYLLIRK